MAEMRRRALTVAAAATVLLSIVAPAPAWADTSPGPTVPGVNACRPEQFPHGGAARSASYVPYEIPFTATLGQTTPQGVREGGYLEVANSLVTATLGGPLLPDPTTGKMYGNVFANACGLVQLPSETGGISSFPSYGKGADKNYNNDFVFVQPAGISVTLGITGVPVLLLSAFGAADGNLAAAINTKPAANGGLNVTFMGGAKSTSDFSPALKTLIEDLLPGSIVTLPIGIQQILTQLGATLTSVAGAACTLAIGDLATEGVPNDAGLTPKEATSPVVLTTGKSGNITGEPVTGPITNSDATLVSNDFPVGAIQTNTVPAPDYPGTPTCTQSNATLLNDLLGLPSVPDPSTNKYPNTFYAPGTFSVFTSS